MPCYDKCHGETWSYFSSEEFCTAVVGEQEILEGQRKKRKAWERRKKTATIQDGSLL